MNYLLNLFNIKNKVDAITGGSGVPGTEMAKGLLRGSDKSVIRVTDEK